MEEMVTAGRESAGARRPEPPSSSRSAANRLAVAALLFLVGYSALIGYRHVAGLRHDEELFPFFGWSLFSKVPGPELVDFGVRLTAIRGEPLPEPLYYENASGHVAFPHAPDIHVLVGQLGRRLTSGDLGATAYVRKVLEDRFLDGHDHTTYEIVRRRYDALERLRCTCYLEETVVASFEVGA